MQVVQIIESGLPKFRFTKISSNLANLLQNNLHKFYHLQKEIIYVINFYKNKYMHVIL